MSLPLKAPALYLQDTATSPPCSVGDVQAVMLWTNPWLTARVFGGGLYSLVCLRQLLSGGLQGHMLGLVVREGLMSCRWCDLKRHRQTFFRGQTLPNGTI